MREGKIINVEIERFPILQFIGLLLLYRWTYTGVIPFQVTICLVLFLIDDVTVNLKKLFGGSLN